MHEQISPSFNGKGAPSPEQALQRRASKLPPSVQIEIAVLRERQNTTLNELRVTQKRERPERLREETMKILQQMLPPKPTPRGVAQSTRSLREQAEERAAHNVRRNELSQESALKNHLARQLDHFVQKAERRMEKEAPSNAVREFNKAVREPFIKL